uniref:OB_NTP_bind domain-containing protein n=1 Tax=Ascaris lumbricoides TaxID=6252 RepID=A0A0M3HNH0_ASCLU
MRCRQKVVLHAQNVLARYVALVDVSAPSTATFQVKAVFICSKPYSRMSPFPNLLEVCEPFWAHSDPLLLSTAILLFYGYDIKRVLQEVEGPGPPLCTRPRKLVQTLDSALDCKT